jgi:Viral coat protein P2 N-terminal domain
MTFKLPLTNLQNVGPGNTATLKIPAGRGTPTYDVLFLELGGTLTAAHIERLTLKANGRIVVDEGSGTVLNLREAYRGITTNAAYIAIDFTEPRARNGMSEQLLSAIPGNLLADLSLEIKIASGAPAGGTIKAHALFRPPTANPFILKRLNTTQSFAAAGSASAPNIAFLPVGGAGGKLKRIWLHESVAGTTSEVQIRVANNSIFEATRAQIEHHQRRYELVPQTGVVVVDFVEDGNLAGVLDTAQAPAVELRLVNGAACTYSIWYEYIDPISRL